MPGLLMWLYLPQHLLLKSGYAGVIRATRPGTGDFQSEMGRLEGTAQDIAGTRADSGAKASQRLGPAAGYDKGIVIASACSV